MRKQRDIKKKAACILGKAPLSEQMRVTQDVWMSRTDKVVPVALSAFKRGEEERVIELATEYFSRLDAAMNYKAKTKEALGRNSAIMNAGEYFLCRVGVLGSLYDPTIDTTELEHLLRQIGITY